jgi:death-on-curing protein
VSSPSDYRWISENVVLAIHEAQIDEHGGSTGVRDLGLLSSALARPQNAAAYAKPDIPELAALYALGVIKNHPFIDGNKRVGTVLLELFLEDNGYELVVIDESLLNAITTVAAGDMSEEQFVAWVRARCAISAT